MKRVREKAEILEMDEFTFPERAFSARIECITDLVNYDNQGLVRCFLDASVLPCFRTLFNNGPEKWKLYTPRQIKQRKVAGNLECSLYSRLHFFHGGAMAKV